MERLTLGAASRISSARLPGKPTQKGYDDVEARYELVCQFADEFFIRYGEGNELTRWASKAKAQLEAIRRGPKVA